MLKQSANVFFLLLFWNHAVTAASIFDSSQEVFLLAGINISEPKVFDQQSSPENKEKKPRPDKTNKVLEYEIKGYIKNNQYVRVNVKIDQKNILSGYMFIEDAPAEYVYGKLENGVLYMYDTKGELFSILLAK